MVAHPQRAHRDARRPRRSHGAGPGPATPHRAPRRHRARRRRPRHAARGLRHPALGGPPGHHARRGHAGRPRPRLGRRPEGDDRPPARAARPRSRVAQHRPPGRDEGRLGVARPADRRLRQRRLRGAEERTTRRTPQHPQHGGPAVRPDRVVRHLGPAHRAARGPLLPDPAARRARPRGDDPRDQGRAHAVRLPRVRGGRHRAGRGPDLPGGAAPARPAPGLLTRPLARARRRGPLQHPHRAGRVDPVSDPRSDWFVRRLPSAVDDTIPS